MKILWITNIVFPEARFLMNESNDFKSSGGWMIASAKALLKQTNYELSVATVSPNVKKLTKLKGDKINYYIIPLGKGNQKYNKEYEPAWLSIKKDLNPDIIHIHGTEFSHGVSWIKACGAKNVVVSIQGIASEIGKHYTDGLSRWDIYNNITIRDIIKGTCFRDKKKWIKRGLYEEYLLNNVNYVLGRTDWDKKHALRINPHINYFHCDETMRSVFYEGKWNYAKCCPQSIFLSQAYYPIKGLHILLKAMNLIIKEYPHTQLRIAGSDILHYSLIHQTSYFRFLKKLIKSYSLSSHIVFCGQLNAEEMKAEYLKCNLFVCPSSIENSSNALSEALLLGVPCVASNVGGLPTLMFENEQNLYDFNDISTLSRIICNIFSQKGDLHLERDRIKKKFDALNNVTTLINIYKRIYNG